MDECVFGTLAVLVGAWVLGYALLTGGLPRARMWRPRIPLQALRRLERRYDAAVHWLTRGPAPCHAQPVTEPFREIST
jgi:hypothetical protein